MLVLIYTLLVWSIVHQIFGGGKQQLVFLYPMHHAEHTTVEVTAVFCYAVSCIQTPIGYNTHTCIMQKKQGEQYVSMQLTVCQHGINITKICSALCCILHILQFLNSFHAQCTPVIVRTVSQYAILTIKVVWATLL